MRPIAARIRSGRSSPTPRLPQKVRPPHLRSRPPLAREDQSEMALPTAVRDRPRNRAATVYPTLSTTPTATEFRTVSQRAAGMTGQAGEGPAQAAGKDEAVICSTAGGYSL